MKKHKGDNSVKRVLVVDDEDILRILITDSLEDLGFDLEEAEDGEVALEKIENNNYDLFILDYMMPKLTGVDVLDRLSEEKRKDMKILMLTAKAQEKDQEMVLGRGADYFMPKPFSPVDLCNFVEEILND